MKIVEHIVLLDGMHINSCPVCSTPFDKGECYLEIEIDGTRFRLAHLLACCGQPVPVGVLFDSHEPAHQTFNLLKAKIEKAKSYVGAPLISVPG